MKNTIFLVVYLRLNLLLMKLLLLDTGSNDNTLKIAKRYTDKIYYYKWSNDFSAAKNKSLEHATCDWVLFLDCDEELAPGSDKTLIEDMSASNIIGYRLPLENIGSPLDGFNYVPFNRNAPGLHFIGKIHETGVRFYLVLSESMEYEQGNRKTKILHHGYKPDELIK